MEHEVVVIGGGGFARETLDVINAENGSFESRTGRPRWVVRGVVDDRLSAENGDRLERLGVTHLGGLDELEEADWRGWYVVGIGSTSVRRRVADRLDEAGFRAATVVHPSATMGADVRIGEGAVICAGVRLTTNIECGRHVHLNLNTTVGHDTKLGDFVSANPLAAISGDCTIGSGVLIGVGAVVLNGLDVGEGATVGGSACVVRNVDPGVVVKGVPAR